VHFAHWAVFAAGIFAQRGKNRPNRIGSTICQVVRVEGTRLFVSELDAINGTPVIDIKPVMVEFCRGKRLANRPGRTSWWVSIGFGKGSLPSDGHGLSRPLAESILALDFGDHDSMRIAELSSKANEGALTEDEEAELEAYINVGDLLALWQSKARQALQTQAWANLRTKSAVAPLDGVSTAGFPRSHFEGRFTSSM
jgi:hypothetical protein